MSYAGLCFTSSALLLGLAKDAFLPVTMIIAGLAFVIAAGIASYAARPLMFYMPGAKPSTLDEDLANDAESDIVLTQLCSFAEKQIEQNNFTLKCNADLLILSQRLSLCAGLVAAVPQLLKYLHS